MPEGTLADAAGRQSVQVKLIDCDVHPMFRYEDEILEYMPAGWDIRSLRDLRRPVFYEVPNSGMRRDSYPAGGGMAGSDPELFDRQLLHEAGVDFAVHIDLIYGTSPDPDCDAAVKSGINRWLAETWLSKYNRHGRYRGSISVLPDNGPAAVREIDHWAGHPNFVQIRVPDASVRPYGHPCYHPVWEAASRHGLPVAVHAQNGGVAQLYTPVGPFRYYVEWHALNIPLTYAAHLTSLICQGVFDRFPNLKFVFVEGGFLWLAPLLWRLEKSWDALSSELPRLKRRPAEYISEHVRFTSQPVEEPEQRSDVRRLFDMIEADRILMFSTDYPHWDYDDPTRALPPMSEASRQRILCENARELYGLPRRRVPHDDPVRAAR